MFSLKTFLRWLILNYMHHPNGVDIHNLVNVKRPHLPLRKYFRTTLMELISTAWLMLNALFCHCGSIFEKTYVTIFHALFNSRAPGVPKYIPFRLLLNPHVALIVYLNLVKAHFTNPRSLRSTYIIQNRNGIRIVGSLLSMPLSLIRDIASTKS